MERYNKSTMPVNAEKYFMTHRGIRTLDNNTHTEIIYAYNAFENVTSR